MFADLSQRYGASVGVTREALTWLSSQGLVQSTAHQGYVVTPLSVPDLTELTEARILIEPLVLRASFETGDTAWEATVLSAHHVLSRTPPPNSDQSLGDDALDRWAETHADFHDALVSACPNKRLLKIVKQLHEEAAMYRRWSVSLVSYHPESAGEHTALLEAALVRDWELAGDVLRAHYRHTQANLSNYAAEHPDERA
jgi:DNA-binding GntR family transcriptional regulator